MTMQSYLESGTGGHDIDARPELVRNRLRLALRVVVAHEHAVALGHQAVVGLRAHLELEPDARALELARPHVRADLLVVERRRAVRDVALGEDESEGLAARGSAARDDGADVVDPRGLEEAEELDVVHVLHGVEVAEAHPLHHREPPVRAQGLRSGICMRAIAFTRNQNRVPAAPITTSVTSTATRLLAIRSSTEKSTIANASTACRTTTAQYCTFHRLHARNALPTTNGSTSCTFAGSLSIFAPAAHAITSSSASAAITIAPTVTAAGRSPSRSGSSAARASASRRSERDGGRLADRSTHGLSAERCTQRSGRRTRIRGVAYGPDHHDAPRAGRHHVGS